MGKVSSVSPLSSSQPSWKRRLRTFLRPILYSCGWILGKCLWLWGKTLRVKVIDPNGYLTTCDQKPRIYILWHNRLLSVVPTVPSWLLKKVVFIASRSDDGQIISNIFESFSMRSKRGSTNRDKKDKGGSSALKGLFHALQEGYSLGITLDGPRGPRYHVYEGVVWLALHSDALIVPISYNSPYCWRLNSWDRMQIPIPFSRGELVVGNGLSFGENSGWDAKRVREEIRNALMAITQDEFSKDRSLS